VPWPTQPSICCRCDNAFSTSWARCSSAFVIMAPSYLADIMHSCVVYNWSSKSAFCCPSRSDNSTQSIGAIWITQPFDLELFATDCSRPEPHSLVSAADLKLSCTSKHIRIYNTLAIGLYEKGRTQSQTRLNSTV